MQILCGRMVSQLSASTSPRPSEDHDHTLIETNSVEIENLEKQMQEIRHENGKLKTLIEAKNIELSCAQSEIEKFSQNFVSNILDVDLPMPKVQESESEEEVENIEG